MLYTTLGKTGLKVSRATFGGIIDMDETPEDAVRYVAYAVEQGVNYFDVAPSYGNAEERLGPALKPYRKAVNLACKTGKRDAAGAREELLNSLKMLQTDHFDVYQLHSMTTEEDVERAFGPGGAMETMEWARREGLVRNIGFSAHSEDIAVKLMDLYDFDSVLFPMNWALGINTGWGDRISERVKRSGAGLLAMKTLILRTWREGEERIYPKSWCRPIHDDDALAVAAMKYGIYKGADTLIPPGNINHFRLMLKYIDRVASEPLTDEEWALLRERAAQVKSEPIFNA